jgi:prolyl 4-hydroxylase
MIDIDHRCPPLGDDVRPSLLPGELNAMFERIVNTAPGNRTDDPNYVLEEGMTNYTVTVHSRPRSFGPDEEVVIGPERDLEEPPWVITFENFVTVEECEHLISLGYKSEYERSEDVGDLLPDGTFDSIQSESRTSTK